MARSRNIKPGFFTNDDLVELDFAIRLLFAGLWTIADREGRLQDRPKKIKIGLFPADSVDVDAMLQSLHDKLFITRYEVCGGKFIQINTWAKHQNPHHTEKASEIPDQNGSLAFKELAKTGGIPLKTGDIPLDDGGNLADSLLPLSDSLLPLSGSREERVSPSAKPPQPKIPNAAKGTRYPADATLPADWRIFCQQERPDINPERVHDNFKDHWLGEPGSSGLKSDWPATWRKWVRNEKPAPGAPTTSGPSEQAKELARINAEATKWGLHHLIGTQQPQVLKERIKAAKTAIHHTH